MGPMPRDRWLLPTLALLCLPYYFNDFANIYLHDWRLWLSIDYLALKVVPGFYLLWLLRRRYLRAADLGLRRQSFVSFLVTTVILSLLAVVIDQNAYRWLAALPGYPSLGSIPLIDNPFWKWFDLTVGLLAVGFFEEVVFRGYLAHVISRFTTHPAVILPISALAFGLIHWSSGLHAVLVSAGIGTLFMIAYLRTRSLAAPIVAHFVVNFVAYAGVLPPAWFRLF